VVVEDLSLSEAKTKLMAQVLSRLVGDESAVILIPDKTPAYEVVIRSTSNLPGTKTLLASYLNIRDLLTFDKIVLPLQSLDVISAHLG
jgi:large subunit ribosomal protein L4